MSFTDSDSSKIRKQILLRYPWTFYEEVSRQLIIFKTYRGNKKVFRALPVMDELIDYAAMDPLTGKYAYEIPTDEKTNFELINIPQELIESFKRMYHGTPQEYDSVFGIKHLSPGTSVQDKDASVIIRKPMKFTEAYGDHPAEWTAFKAGFNYKVSRPTPSGFPITETIPMVSWNDEDIATTFTTEIPRSVWTVMYEKAWAEIGPVCTRIERFIAATLTAKGFSEGSASNSISMSDADAGEFDGDDPRDLA